MKKSTASFFKSQLQNAKCKNSGRRWTIQDKAQALGIFYRGQQAYKTLSSIFLMPSPSTLNRFVSGIPCKTGLNSEILQMLGIKISQMHESARICSITFDKMSIRKELAYNAILDTVEGLVNLPSKQLAVCNQALVFMLRGITANWKQPLAYFFSENAAPGKFLHATLKEVIMALTSIHLKPVVVVCDQGTCNRSLYRLMNITEDRPFFMVDEMKIYALHDTPHILKNVRNTLKKQDIFFNNGQIASWRHIVDFFKIDVNLPVRMAPKITTKHIYLPPFTPMKVNLAAQICSHFVYAAIHTLVALEKMPTEALQTANFLKEVNDIFDFLNVRNLANKSCRPITEENMFKFDDFNEKVKLWSIKTNAPPCFAALRQNLNGMKLLSQDLLGTGTKFILSGRINQDCLENFFSQVRARGGHRFNPSAREFQYAYRSLSANILITPIATSNCLTDTDYILLTLQNLSSAKTSTKRKDRSDDLEMPPSKKTCMSSSNTDVIVESMEDFKLSCLVENVICYVGGYILRKISMKHDVCQICLAQLSNKCHTIESNQLLCHYKAYHYKESSAFGSLYIPSESCIHFLTRIESVFQKQIGNLITEDKILHNIMMAVERDVPLTLLDVCDDHKSELSLQKMIIQIYLRCRLYYFFKFETKKLHVKNPRNNKAKILQHE